MYKLAVKLLVVTVVLTGAILLLSSDRAAALANNCPATDTGLPAIAYNGSNVIWGNDSDGEGSGLMSSLIMKARDTSGNPLNPHFTLQSEAPASADDAQIYRWPIGEAGSVSNTDAWPQGGDFQFGTTMHNGAGNPVQCNGWIVLGPGTQGHVGNGWVLNCKTNGSDNIFWISHIDNPGGQDGRWEMLDASGTVVDSNVNSGSAPHIKFGVVNGSNKRYTFVWHPTEYNHGGGGANPQCKNLDVTGSGEYWIDNNSNGVYDDPPDKKWDTYTHYKVTDGNFDAAGNFVDVNTLAEGGDSGYGPNPGHWTPSYQPRQPRVKVHIVRKYRHLNGTDWVETTFEDTTYTKECYSASCGLQQIVGNVPGGPGNGVIADTQFTLAMWVRDDWSQTIYPTIGGASQNGTGLDSYMNQGDVEYAWFTIRAPPGGPQNWTVNFSLYDSASGLSWPCSATVPVYQYFTLEPHAKALPSGTAENPGSIQYSTYVKNNASVSVPAQTTSTFKTTPFSAPVTCANVGPVVTNGPYAGGGANTYTIGPASCTPSSVNAGDQYCSQIDFTGGYNSGYVGPNGEIVPAGMDGPSGDSQCVTIVNKPYFKAFNSSVSAGGAFSNAGNCSGDGVLGGWNDNTGAQSRGAGAQLSALALIKITGVASAQTSVPNSPVGAGLTFANSGAGVVTNTDRESPSLGGNHNSGGSYCLPNVEPPSGATSVPGLNLTIPANGNNESYVRNGNLVLNSASSIRGSKSVFVNGNVYITSDFKYNTIATWSINTDGSTNVPSFVLHATGNIYIAPGATQLDGLYVSENKIYTCANNNGGGNFAPVTAGNMYTACNQQLTVNGAFVATQVNLLRTYGSLRNATAGERPTTGNHGCSYSGGSSNKPVCAGEIFYLSPELYLSTPNIQLPSNGATRYDAITSLPPVL